MRDLNKNQTKRDLILFGCSVPLSSYSGGVKSFKYLDLERVKKLFEDNFIDPASKQNLAPSTQWFYDFITKYPSCNIHGYAVSKERLDYRVSFEGLSCEDPETLCDVEFVREFILNCRYADSFELTATRAYCWFD